MKMTNKFFGTLMMLIFVSMSTLAQQKDVQTVKIKTSAHCNSCKETIEKALVYERGVKSAVLDMETKVVTVEYKTKHTNPAKLMKVIKDEGYEVSIVTGKKKSCKDAPCRRKCGSGFSG